MRSMHPAEMVLAAERLHHLCEKNRHWKRKIGHINIVATLWFGSVVLEHYYTLTVFRQQ